MSLLLSDLVFVSTLIFVSVSGWVIYGISSTMEEWGHFVAASRKIGNFDKWVVIWGVEVKDVGKVESKKISVKLMEILANLKSATPCVLL